MRLIVFLYFTCIDSNYRHRLIVILSSKHMSYTTGESAFTKRHVGLDTRLRHNGSPLTGKSLLLNVREQGWSVGLYVDPHSTEITSGHLTFVYIILRESPVSNLLRPRGK